MSPESLSRIGRYEIVELVGTGSMGTVYKAFDPLLSRFVAIKTVRTDLIRDDGGSSTPFKLRFYREGQILGSLSHPHIVALYDMGECDDVPYLVMEYWSPGSLATLLATERCLRLDRALALLQPLAEAIDYAHRASVVHLDVKPSNILLDASGARPKVTDFGVAKILGNGLDSSLGLFGTPGYMSPEQVRSETPSHRSDVFSLAVVAFEMLSGERPFPGASVDAVLYRIAHAEPVSPSSLTALGFSEPEWRLLFSRALAKDPGERFASALELVEEMGALGPWRSPFGLALGPLEAPSGTSTEPVPTFALPAGKREPRPQRRGLVSASCAAALAALIAWSGLVAPGRTDVSGRSAPLVEATVAPAGPGTEASPDHVGTSGSKTPPPNVDPPASPGSVSGAESPPETPSVPRVSLSASVRFGGGLLVVENRDAFDWTEVELALGARRDALRLGKLKAGRLYSLPLTEHAGTVSSEITPDAEDITILCQTPMGEGWYSARALASP